MNITSPAFQNGERIPSRHSRYHSDISPPLHIEGAPPGARSLALIMDDPDATKGLFTHWIVFNLDPGTKDIREGTLPAGATEGANGWGEAKYGGPRPPSGEHRYFFHLFALDRKLDLPKGADRAAVEKAMGPHVLEKAVLMGLYPTPAAGTGA